MALLKRNLKDTHFYFKKRGEKPEKYATVKKCPNVLFTLKPTSDSYWKIKEYMFFGLLEALFGLGLRHNEQQSSLKSDMPHEKIITTVVPPQFRDDVENLKSFVGNENWKPGLEIELELRDLLSICPRERRRSDAFKKLIEYLKNEQKIEIKIKTKKQWKQN